MVRKGLVVGLSLLVWQGMPIRQASAGETVAVIDGSGRVVPIRPQPARPVASCKETDALPTDAARALVARIAAEEGFFPEFVLSVAKIESRYVSTALSDKGAFGLMQLMPDTAQRFNVDLCDPEGNVRGGIRFLRSLHERYRNPLFILAAYNAGEEAVRKSRGVPPYPETIRFVADVVNDFYAWPAAAGVGDRPLAGGRPTGAARMAAASLPDIVELDPAGAAAAPNGKPVRNVDTGSRPASPAAPRWNDGFVMHVD